MNSVIPVINCHRGDTAAVEHKLDVARAFSDTIHLDVADARFTEHASWAEPETWKHLARGLQLEVHLMVENPTEVIGVWLDVAGAKRVIVHLEAVRALGDSEGATIEMLGAMKAACASRGAELVIALNPETPIAHAVHYAKTVENFCLLAVYPGPAAQPFLPLTLDKIRALRAALPSAKIEVDGGVTPETARTTRAAGADSVCAGTYIFEASNPHAAFTELQNAVQ